MADQKHYNCQVLSVREQLDRLKNKPEVETKSNVQQLVINKAILRNQIVKLTPLLSANEGLSFSQLEIEELLMENASITPIKPIKHSENKPYKLYTYRLKPGKYLQLISTKRGSNLNLEFSLLTIDSKLVLTEYRLKTLTKNYESVKSLFFMS